MRSIFVISIPILVTLSNQIQPKSLTKIRWFQCLLLLKCLLFASYCQASPNVTVSIPPVHSLVSMVMKGIAVPKLVFNGQQSPHIQSLRPSMVEKITDADFVIYISGSYEQTIAKILKAESSIESLSLIQALPEKSILDSREKTEDGHIEGDHSDDGHGHGHDEFTIDPHIWLSPAVAIEILRVVSKRLQALDPENQQTYSNNEGIAKIAITELDAHFKQELEATQNQTFLVFHDAFQYFEKAYGLNSIGAVTLRPELLPGAKRMVELREKIHNHSVRCVFSEPQFDNRKIEALVEGLEVRTAVLDPLGSDIESGSDQWIEMMSRLVAAFKHCLS